MATLSLALRLARRELRGGVRGLRIVLACLALGVAAIAAVGTLRAATEAGLRADGARILGGDVEIQLTGRPLAAAAREWIARRGTLSDVVAMRAMAVAPSGERTLVELKAVDGAYPLYGELVLEPPGPLGLAIDPIVAQRLGVGVGDTLRIGEASFRLGALIIAEPDRVASPSVLGPRAMIPLAELPRTQLLQPGSLVQFEHRVRLPPGEDPRAFIAELRRQPFADGGWRVRDSSQAAQSVATFLDRAAAFLTLAGLTALLVGGIGVATGVRAWLDQRGRTIATLRCLGAPAQLIFATYLIQVMALAALGIALGLLLGTVATLALAGVFGAALPVPPRLGFYPAPLALAALYGALTALSFALWPLGRAREIPAAALFRDVVQRADARPRLALLALNALAVLGLVALVVLTAEQPRFALGFCAGAAVTLLLFRAGAAGLTRFARAMRHIRRPTVRLGLANLHRPGAPTALMLVSLGIGLTTLATVALIEGNLRRQIAEQIPAAAPSFFFIDIQNEQAARFDAVARGVAGVSEVQRVPSLRARIVAVNDIPAERVAATPETAWALRGDRGLTYSGPMPPDTRLVAGRWWPADHAGEPLVSFDANLARGWGIGIGDRLTLNVLGRDLTFTIANLRDIAWRGLGINYTLIASPGLLEAAPHTHIATVRNAPEADAPVLRAVTDALPNVSGIRVRDALEAVAVLLGRIGTALTSTASVTLLAGALVLAGAVAATQRRRIRDAVVLKTIGATRAQIGRAFLVEFGLLGATAGLIAAAAGTAASWAVTTYVMRADWAFLPGTLALVVVFCTALVLAFGWAGTALALRARPAPLLRNE